VRNMADRRVQGVLLVLSKFSIQTRHIVHEVFIDIAVWRVASSALRAARGDPWLAHGGGFKTWPPLIRNSQRCKNASCLPEVVVGSSKWIHLPLRVAPLPLCDLPQPTSDGLPAVVSDNRERASSS